MRVAQRSLAYVAIGFLFHSAVADEPDAPKLIGHWRLETDGKNLVDEDSTIVDESLTFVTDESRRAARFMGSASFLRDTSKLLKIGNNDFTISLWIKTADGDEAMPGDVLTLTDASGRTMRLSIVTRSGVTHSQPNWRQLEFGMDDGTMGEWSDHGRPGEAVYIQSLAVFNGSLFAGTCEPLVGQTGRIYCSDGGRQWIDRGGPDTSNSITALAVHKGDLYAGTGKYRLAGSALPESQNANRGGKIFRYQGDDQWEKVGDLPDVEAIGGMVTFRGDLYASSLYSPASLFRFVEDGQWIPCPLPPGDKRVESMIVFGKHLYATSYDNGHVYRFDGEAWTDTGRLGNATQGYAFAIYQGNLYCSTWPEARVYRYVADGDWKDVGRLGEELEVMGMMVYNGHLYAGTLPLAQVYRYDGGDKWTLTGQLDTTPDVKYRRAWTMAEFRGRLFVGTLPSGHVYSMQAGRCASSRRPFPSGWRHVAVVRSRQDLHVYVDLDLFAYSPIAEEETTQDDSADSPGTLELGRGAHEGFHGVLRDVRVYIGALTPKQLIDVKNQ